MRLFPILAAIVVSALVYALVFERARLAEMIGTSQPAAQATTGAGAAPDTVPDTQTDTQTGTPDAAQKGNDPMRVVAVHSQARAIDSAVVLRGRTEAFRQVDVRAETSGRVISEPLRKGTFVETGQTLCRLDPATREATLAEARARRAEASARIPEAEARLEEAQSRVAEAQINDNAAASLSAEGFASEVRVAGTKAALSAARAAVQTARTGLETARAGIEAAEAAVAAASEEIARLDIRAPFAGVLESNTAELGSLLQPGALCATVIQLDPVLLVGFVPETQIDRIAQGAPAQARLASGGQVEGRVIFLSREADPATRTFRVEIEVANPDLALRDGQTAEILISADGTDAHLLPQSALTLNDAGDLGVRIVEQGEAGFLPVTLIRDTPGGVWVSGLPQRVDVIVVGQEYVAEGVPVAATYREIGQ